MRIVIQEHLAVLYTGDGLDVRQGGIRLGTFGKEAVPEVVRRDLDAYDLTARLFEVITDSIR